MPRLSQSQLDRISDYCDTVMLYVQYARWEILIRCEDDNDTVIHIPLSGPMHIQDCPTCGRPMGFHGRQIRDIIEGAPQ